MMAQSNYAVRHQSNVRISMRDGVRLSAKITRPEGAEKFPALMDYYPYRMGRWEEAPPHYHRFARQGYALVSYEARGTGNSEGVTTDVYQDAERDDGVEMVNWIASQPWCDGNVGMWGLSYGAVASWQVAARAPEPLKAIVVRSGTDDIYTEWTNPGGCPRPYMYENYAPLMAAFNFAPPHPSIGDEWEKMWQERLEGSMPWGLGFISHLNDGPYWRARSVRPDYARVKAAAYVIDGWTDWYAAPLLRAFNHLSSPKKALMGPWSHFWMNDALPGPRIDGWREVMRWFDRWLKGIDNGIDREPRVTVFVREYSEPRSVYVEEKGFWRNEDGWPPKRARGTAMYFRADGSLAREADSAPASVSYEYDPRVGATTGMHGGGPFPPFAMPTDQRPDEALSLAYTSAPLAEAVEMIGDATAVLEVESTARVAYFHVKLCDVAPDGMSMLVTRAGLNATHRNSHERPELLEPGKRYALRFTLLSAAHRFAAGHRIRVSVASADFQNAWPTPYRARNTLHLGASCVILPVVEERGSERVGPSFQSSEHPLPRVEDLKPPEYVVAQHPLVRSASASFVNSDVNGTNRASFTVNADDPAVAVVDASHEMTVPVPGGEVTITSKCITRSDREAFHQTQSIEAKMNGQTRFAKTWEVSVPREGC